VFYGCGDYPKCDVVFWDKPVDQKCPNCDAPFLLEKTTKRDGTVRYCQNEECGYKISVESSDVGNKEGTAEVVPA
jgi:DNA topoisomerase-1